MATPAGIAKIEEVSEYTGIPVNTLRYLRAQNRGPKSTLLGGRVCYRMADVDRWLNDQFTATN